MAGLNYLKTAVCSAALLCATGASADVSIDDVWAELQSQLDMYGPGIVTIGTETRTSTALVIDAITIDVESENLNVLAEISALTLTDNGDGSVTITMADTTPITLSGSGGDGAWFELRNTGFMVTVSGAPDLMIYDTVAASYVIELLKAVDHGEELDIELRVGITDFSAHTATAFGEINHFDSTTHFGTVDMALNMNLPSDNVEMSAGFLAENLATSIVASIPDVLMNGEMDESEIAAQFLAIRGKLEFSFDSISGQFNLDEDDEQAQGAFALDTGSVAYGYDGSTFSYKVGYDAASVQFSDDEAAVALNVNAFSFGVGVRLPFAQMISGGVDPEYLSPFLSDMKIGVDLSFGDMLAQVSIIDGDDTGGGALSIAGANFNIDVTRDVFDHQFALGSTTLQAISPELPFPVNVDLGEFEFAFHLPLSAVDAPEDFDANLTIADLSLNEEIWSMFDPTGALPHDTATLIIKLAGKLQWLGDMFSPELMNSDVPAALHELTLNELTIDMVGVHADGTGAFTFDNSDLETYDGLPRPEGEATFNITGANSLLDKLVEMGLLPGDQVMGVRMMMGMFANSTGDDALTSTITVDAQGRLLANGQQLR
ncbi:MAG: DUF2125 domain-containing protein [Rhodobacteraceae bacterium]|nr:DUF2125 domain-containing protein [Paracoccaceae bacterium]